MIVVKNVEKVIDEVTTEPFESGGEMEKFLADQFRVFLHQTFGFKAKTEVKR